MKPITLLFAALVLTGCSVTQLVQKENPICIERGHVVEDWNCRTKDNLKLIDNKTEAFLITTIYENCAGVCLRCRELQFEQTILDRDTTMIYPREPIIGLQK